MSIENLLWGAPRIHGELLKLGFEVAQSSVAKYMVKRRGPPSQGWRTFLRNHVPEVAAMDLFVVPTIGFDLLYAFIIIRLDRRELVCINVTTNPTAEWIARRRHSLGMRLGVTSSAIGIASMAPSSHADCGACAFGTNRSHQRVGKQKFGRPSNGDHNFARLIEIDFGRAVTCTADSGYGATKDRHIGMVKT
jgi:hypothetical protein